MTSRHPGTTPQASTGASHQQAPITKAGHWFAARQAGKRLPEHLFPEELEAALATQRMEQLP